MDDGIVWTTTNAKGSTAGTFPKVSFKTGHFAFRMPGLDSAFFNQLENFNGVEISFLTGSQLLERPEGRGTRRRARGIEPLAQKEKKPPCGWAEITSLRAPLSVFE